MKPIVLPETVNYIAVFLTLECNLNCSYCINRFGTFTPEQRQLSGNEWVTALNRIIPRVDLPITLQGGEPTLHPDFSFIINKLRTDAPVDLLTNLEFDVEKFMDEVKPGRMKRNAPYASIRISYHPESMRLVDFTEKVMALQNAGYSVGVWGVLHPSYEPQVCLAAEYCNERGIDFRIKEFLGEHEGRFFGTLSYPGSCGEQEGREVICRSTELIIGPDGGVFRCHSDLYGGKTPIGNVLDPDFVFESKFRSCTSYGFCNPCDVKAKTDRFQVSGHTAVEIRGID